MLWPTDKKLFLLPGLDGTGELFGPLLKELPEECITEIISYPFDQPQTFEQHVQYVVEKLPQNEPIILLAESFSGPVAIEILKSGKFQIELVIFVATFAKSPRPILLGLAKYLPLSRLLKYDLPKVVVRYFCLGKQATKKQIESFNKIIKKVAPEVLAQRLKILAVIDLREALKGINIPCCYIKPSDDKLVPSSSIYDFVVGIKIIKIKPVNGPHFVLQAEPKRCAEAICKEAT